MARTLRGRGRGRRTLRGRPRRVGRGIRGSIRVGRRTLRNLLSRRRRTPIKGPSVRNIDNVKSVRKLRGGKPVRKRRTPPKTTDRKFAPTPMPLLLPDPKKVYPKKGTKMPKKRGIVPPTPKKKTPLKTAPVKGPKKILTKKDVAKPKRPAVGGLKTSPTTAKAAAAMKEELKAARYLPSLNAEIRKAKAPVKKAVVKAPKTSARVGPKPSTKEPVYKKTKSTTPVRSGRGRSYGGGAKPKPKVSGTLTKKQRPNPIRQKGSLRKKFG